MTGINNTCSSYGDTLVCAGTWDLFISVTCFVARVAEMNGIVDISGMAVVSALNYLLDVPCT